MKNQTFVRLRTSIISSILLLLSLVSFGQADSASRIHIGFFYPVSSNGTRAAAYTNWFSLHAIAGVSRAETSFTLSGVVSVVKQNASGVQIAGTANVIGGSASGAQIAGSVNVIGDQSSGAQIAGFANVTRNEAKGAQIAGFMNYAGTANAAQIAGFANISAKDNRGFQLSGFLNKSKNVHSQISGFANIANKVRGVQLAGFINIADSSDYPIAIFNFIKNGEKTLGVSLDESMTSVLSFRSGGRVLYGIAGVGYNLKDNVEPLYAAEAGLGAHISIAEPFRINIEAVSHTLTDFEDGHYFKNSLRILPSFRLAKRIDIFAGPTINYVSYDRENDFDFVKRFIWKNDSSKDFQGVFVGFSAGLQIVL